MSTTCRDCAAGLDHSHAASVAHADGVTECLGDEPCDRPHHLHEWTVSCAETFDACRCAVAPEPLPVPVQMVLPMAA
jgi:hypothetical protein